MRPKYLTFSPSLEMLATCSVWSKSVSDRNDPELELWDVCDVTLPASASRLYSLASSDSASSGKLHLLNIYYTLKTKNVKQSDSGT